MGCWLLPHPWLEGVKVPTPTFCLWILVLFEHCQSMLLRLRAFYQQLSLRVRLPTDRHHAQPSSKALGLLVHVQTACNSWEKMQILAKSGTCDTGDSSASLIQWKPLYPGLQMFRALSLYGTGKHGHHPTDVTFGSERL